MTEPLARRNSRVNYPNLDTTKLAMAFLVVEIHARPLMGFPLFEKIIEGIDVVTVPFFFIASAFLCFHGLDECAFIDASYLGTARVRKTIGKLLRLYLTWTLLFLPLTVLGNILLDNSFSRALLMFLRGMLLVGENCYSWPLWYLLASVVGFTLVYICLRGGVLEADTSNLPMPSVTWIWHYFHSKMVQRPSCTLASSQGLRNYFR